jgi:hypothetical protein
MLQPPGEVLRACCAAIAAVVVGVAIEQAIYAVLDIVHV